MKRGKASAVHNRGFAVQSNITIVTWRADSTLPGNGPGFLALFTLIFLLTFYL
jgi:hypothetical protein